MARARFILMQLVNFIVNHFIVLINVKQQYLEEVSDTRNVVIAFRKPHLFVCFHVSLILMIEVQEL